MGANVTGKLVALLERADNASSRYEQAKEGLKKIVEDGLRVALAAHGLDTSFAMDTDKVQVSMQIKGSGENRWGNNKMTGGEYTITVKLSDDASPKEKAAFRKALRSVVVNADSAVNVRPGIYAPRSDGMEDSGVSTFAGSEKLPHCHANYYKEYDPECTADTLQYKESKFEKIGETISSALNKSPSGISADLSRTFNEEFELANRELCVAASEMPRERL